MKKIFFLGAGVLFSFMGRAQVVPLRAANWDFMPGAVEFGGGPAGVGADGGQMKIVGPGYVVLKNVDFADGTIEFDDQPMNENFNSFFFHFQDSLENEIFYFRTARGVGHPNAREGVQYAPMVKGVNCWNVMDHYQGFATFGNKAPNHVKLVISGKQMRVYVNSQRQPTLEIPRLEGNTTHGTLAFRGEAIISHLVLRRGQVEGLESREGPDPTSNDSRYIRHWQVTKADTIPAPMDFTMALYPGKETVWSPLDAERRGFVNLTRLYGGGYPRHHIAFLKTTIHADSARQVTMRLGFLDEVWVFLNGEWAYVDKNLFQSPIAKVPKGRMSLENAMLRLPLKRGDNELVIGVGNNFFGWGIMARLDDIEGITLE